LGGKDTLAFVNHKCVPIDDVSSAIEAQAREKFVDRWGLTDIISLGGTSDGEKEASDYESKLKAIPESKLPRDGDGFPMFDLALVGVGDDGHIAHFIQTEIRLKQLMALGSSLLSKRIHPVYLLHFL